MTADDVAPQHRVIYRGKHLEIRAVIPELKPVDAGELRERIQLERDVVTRENGVEKRAPEVYTTIWAKDEALSGRELWQAQQAQSRVTWKFTIRHGRFQTALMCEEKASG